MRVSAKADYAVRAAIALAAGASEDWPLKGAIISTSQKIPLPFLQNIFAELRHQGIVNSRRGSDGGHWLARPADDVTVAEVMRAAIALGGTITGEHGVGRAKKSALPDQLGLASRDNRRNRFSRRRPAHLA